MKRILATLAASTHPFLTTCVVGVVAVGVMCGGVVVNRLITQERAAGGSIAALDKQCSKPVEDGFGVVRLGSNTVITSQTGTIKSDCIIELQEGIRLELTDVKITSQKLYIRNAEGAKNTSLSINGSVLSSPSGGFQVSFSNTSSAAKISSSRLEYPLSVGIAVGKDDEDFSAWLQIEDSEFISNNSNSEGIYMASTGSATFKRNNFELYEVDDFALLLAPNCSEEANTGANQNCQVQ